MLLQKQLNGDLNCCALLNQLKIVTLEFGSRNNITFYQTIPKIDHNFNSQFVTLDFSKLLLQHYCLITYSIFSSKLVSSSSVEFKLPIMKLQFNGHFLQIQTDLLTDSRIHTTTVRIKLHTQKNENTKLSTEHRFMHSKYQFNLFLLLISL